MGREEASLVWGVVSKEEEEKGCVGPYRPL